MSVLFYFPSNFVTKVFHFLIVFQIPASALSLAWPGLAWLPSFILEAETERLRPFQANSLKYNLRDKQGVD